MNDSDIKAQKVVNQIAKEIDKVVDAATVDAMKMGQSFILVQNPLACEGPIFKHIPYADVMRDAKECSDVAGVHEKYCTCDKCLDF